MCPINYQNKACNFIKKRFQHRCFPVNIVKFLKHLFWRTIAYGCFWSDFRKWLFKTLFLESCFQNHPDFLILQKHESLTSQTFKHNSAHIPSLNSSPTLSFEPRFHTFIINGYGKKKQTLVFLVFFVLSSVLSIIFKCRNFV